MSGYVTAGALVLGAGTAIDSANRAQHQQRLQAEQQAQQLQQAQQMQQTELAQAERLQRQQIEAQQRAQAASLAQANQAASESKALMDKQLKAADENMNRINQKRPNTNRILDEASQAGRAGASGTMLTGSAGVDPSTLTLGRNTLLGA